ncbi:MAG: hypothetical protein PHO89_11245 [Methylacidiphilaceae bacterium]|nr:hypothetical protein [Candidatus Methylacidiphilaceae bacterium]
MNGNCVRPSWLALWVTLLLAFVGSFSSNAQITFLPPQEAAASSEQSSGSAGLVNNAALPSAAAAPPPAAPSDPSATPAPGDAAGSGAASAAGQDGSTAPTPATACCPSPPGQQAPAQTPPQQESGGPRYGPDGNIIPEYTSGQGPEDAERGNKWKQPLMGKGKTRAHSGTSSSVSSSQTPFSPPPALLPEQLDDVNRLVVAELQKELQNGALTRELCLDSVFRVYAFAGAPIDPRIQALNTKLDNYNALVEKLSKQYKSPWPLQWTPEEISVANHMVQGRYDSIDPNLQWLAYPIQSGDICQLPPYYVVEKDQKGNSATKLKSGHIGIVIFNAKKNQWELVSTNNVEANHKVHPGWSVQPLDAVVEHYNEISGGQWPIFFHWIGPSPSAPGP